MKIEKAIKQQRFKSEQEKLIINLLFTASWVKSESGKVLKPYGLSIPLFNVLRILKGQMPAPISVLDIQQRMLDQQSNASRLVDRLVKNDLAERVICPDDRRKMDVTITTKGAQLLDKLTPLMQDIHKEIVALSAEEQQEVNTLLDKMRTKRKEK